jgi:hypothetical protein
MLPAMRLRLYAEGTSGASRGRGVRSAYDGALVGRRGDMRGARRVGPDGGREPRL